MLAHIGEPREAQDESKLRNAFFAYDVRPGASDADFPNSLGMHRLFVLRNQGTCSGELDCLTCEPPFPQAQPQPAELRR
jgi:hypothetical protein